jgi:hypothetical protein
MVAVTWKTPSGWLEEESVQAYEQSVVALGFDAEYGAPGPSQVTTFPSPMFQTTLVGVAVAVAITAPTVAEALTACQVPESIQSHDATFTNCVAPTGGAISMVG